MRNLTLAIDEEMLLAARKLALERDTTVNQMVREYLRRLVEEDGARRDALARLRRRMRSGVMAVRERAWSRDDLHER